MRRKLRKWKTITFVSAACVFLLIIHTLTKKRLKEKPAISNARKGALYNKSRDFGFGEFPPRYKPPYDNSTVGHSFNADRVTLERLGVPLKAFTNVDEFNVGRFVVATAASEQYLPYALDAIGTVQYYLPQQRIIFYDLGGLSPMDIDKVSRLCSVTYKKFDATRFGSNVWNKRGYAWKPIIIHEVLREHIGVLWIDSSVRFSKGNLTKVFSDVVRAKGALMMTSTGHSIYSATHPQMYQYLPTEIFKMQEVDQHEAGCIFMFRTKNIYENILRWWVLCALDSNCIAPTSELNCGDIYGGGKSTYANCHRFDQSALNILMANYYNFNDRSYFTSDIVSSVKRFHMGDSLLKICSFGEKDKWMHVRTYFKELFAK